MLKVSAANVHDTLHIEEDVITLNGPPQALTGTISLQNKAAQTIFIRELPFSPTSTDKRSAFPGKLKLLLSLQGGEHKTEQLNFQLPASTPPGVYEQKLLIGDKEKTVRVVVQPAIDIDITPMELYFQGVVPGNTYSAELTLTNNGNLPFKVPGNIRHTTMLDEDYLCRALSLAIRENGADGFKATMDSLTQNIHKELTDWVDIRMEESGKIVDPGKSLSLHLSLTLPRNVHPSRDYSGNIRIWKNIVSYHINAYENDKSFPK